VFVLLHFLRGPSFAKGYGVAKEGFATPKHGSEDWGGYINTYNKRRLPPLNLLLNKEERNDGHKKRRKEI